LLHNLYFCHRAAICCTTYTSVTELLFVAQPILLSQSRVVVPPRYVMQLKDMEAIF